MFDYLKNKYFYKKDILFEYKEGDFESFILQIENSSIEH